MTVMADDQVQRGYTELIAVGWAWSDFSRPVFRFAEVLRAADLMPEEEDGYWEKPWKWSAEHQLWVDVGEPVAPGPDAPATLAWERFTRGAKAQQQETKLPR